MSNWKDAIEELETILREKDDEIEELEKDVRRMSDEYEMADEFKGMGKIVYKTDGNIVDDELMEAVSRVLEKLSPRQFIDKLNSL